MGRPEMTGEVRAFGPNPLANEERAAALNGVGEIGAPSGAASNASSCDLSSRASRTRTLTSNASTRPIATKCSTPTCSNRSSRCGRSPNPGCANTTRSGRTTASAECRPSASCRGEQRPQSLLSSCVLDGGAYGIATSVKAMRKIVATRHLDRVTVRNWLVVRGSRVRVPQPHHPISVDTFA